MLVVPTRAVKYCVGVQSIVEEIRFDAEREMLRSAAVHSVALVATATVVPVR